MRRPSYLLPFLLLALWVIAVDLSAPAQTPGTARASSGGGASAAQPAGADSLLNIVRQNKRDKAEASALIELSDRYNRTDFHQSIAFIRQAIDIALAANLSKELCVGYEVMVNCQHEIGLKDSAIFYLGKLKAAVGASPQYRSAYTHAAGLFYRRENDLRSAQPFLLESMQINEEHAKTDSSVNTLTNLAGATLNVSNNLSDMGDYQSAQKYALRALDLFERVGNKKGISFIYQTLGGIFLQLHQLRQANDYTQRSLALKIELSDLRGQATALHQLGSVFRYQKHFDSAIKYNLTGLAIDQRLGLKLDEIRQDHEIGDIYQELHNDTAAKGYFERGKAIADAIGDTTYVRTFEAALIAVRDDKNESGQTEARLLRAAGNAGRSHEVVNMEITYQYLADYYANTGQTKKALDYLAKYYDLFDSLQNLNTQVQLRKMEGQYNVDKKEKEIALLKKDQQLNHADVQRQNAALIAQNAVLGKQRLFQYGAGVLFVLLALIGFLMINRYRLVDRARRTIELEKMRNHIARDLHDDIGSTLSSINILSKVALQTSVDDVPVGSLEKIRDRSAAIMEKMDDIVWTINPQNDTMEQLLFRMKEFAAEMLEPLNINYSFEEDGDFSTMKLDIRKRKDLYLLFKEAVNNAAKYSQCRNLHIHLRRENDSLQLEITDDGKGFAAETIRAGNGLKNMRERAASMLGRLHIDSTVGQGTRIGLDLPIT